MTVKAGADHITDLASAKPVSAISELIWNGFDAKSNSVEVIINKNPFFDSIDSIIVKDYGSGIDHNKVTDLFGNLGESWKKQARANGDRSLHGQYGRGRFKALSLGEKIHWKTSFSRNGEGFEYVISSDANSVKDFDIGILSKLERPSDGTQVEITNVSDNVDYLLSDEAVSELVMEFALFLTEYPNRKLIFCGTHLKPEDAWEDKTDFDLGDIELPNESKTKVSLSIIEWKKKNIQREFHYCDSLGFSYYKEKLGQLVRAPGYEFTIYAKCDYFKALSERNEITLGDMIPELKVIKDAVLQKTRLHFIDKAFVKKTKIVDSWKEQEIYPYDDEMVLDPTKIVERKVFDILAVNVQSYLRNFEKADKKTKKFTFMLLSQAIKQNPASVQKIISEVLGLKRKEQDELAELLESTTLSSIISASKIVTDRLNFLNGLDNLVHDKETKKFLLERDQLHKILEREAWLFKEDFFLAGTENRLEEVLQKHIKHLGKREDDLTPEPVYLPDGRQGRVDLMFAKARQPYEGFTEYLVVELKRPSQKIDYDVIGQVEKYALAVSADERFDHANSKWTFIAVSNSMDAYATKRARQRGWPKGKTLDDADANVEVWVMTWSEVIHAARSKLSFFSEQLKYQATRGSSTDYLEQKHKEFLPAIPAVENVNP
ncbi:hypothetical protein ABF63_18720 [Enterobacter hormaechei subsp. steigerwaltii]|nr:hypothetical protein ABF63_18720 [Enterobacter hormaechei subsp. steigerwaltii]